MTERFRLRLLSLLSAVILLCVAASLVREKGPMAKKVYLVDVDASKTPLFSEQCAVCMLPRQEPLTALHLTATHGRMEYYLYGFTKPYPNEHTLQLPVHAGCVKGVRNDFIRCLTLIVAASVLTGVALYAGRWGGFSAAMSALVVFGLLLSLSVNTPMPVEYSLFRSGKVRFFFSKRALADDFARRNGGEVREGTYLTEYYPG